MSLSSRYFGFVSIACAAMFTIMPMQAVAGQIVNHISVSGDSGGVIGNYVVRAATYRRAETKIDFTGRCDSACTLFLSLSPSQICVSEGAYFRFHLPQSPSPAIAVAAGRFLMRSYPAWVRTYITSHGGLSDRLLTVDYSYASRFIKKCPSIVASR
jgi:hypothetical protein